MNILISENRLGSVLLKKYPSAHDIRTEKALYDFTVGIKNEYLRKSQPLSKVIYDGRINVIQHALGTHTFISRVQGAKLKAKNEIRIASVFKHTPLEFLKMIVVHELAHLKEKEHNKAFYQLCEYMEPAVACLHPTCQNVSCQVSKPLLFSPFPKFTPQYLHGQVEQTVSPRTT